MRESENRISNDRERQRLAEYASAEEFCKIFSEDMKSLYLLALMLTRSHKLAVTVFMDALSDGQKASVFRPWARSWSRLAVIERAMKSVKPTETAGREIIFDEDANIPEGLGEQLASVLRLDAFHRFVFVLTVLEPYSVGDCAILLKQRKREIESARQRVMSAIAVRDAALLFPGEAHLPAALSA